MHTNQILDQSHTAVAEDQYGTEWSKIASPPGGAAFEYPAADSRPRRRTPRSSDRTYETRLQRLLKLIEIMRSDQAFTADALATRMAVSRRTIFRDITMMARIGIPIRLDEHRRGYRINQWYFLPPTNLNLLEAAGLYIAARKMASSQTYPLSVEALQGIEKIAQTLPSSQRDICRQMAEVVEFRMPAMVDTAPTRRIFQVLLRAAVDRRKVLLDLDATDDPDKDRIVLHPYRLTLLGHTWYVIGYCERRQKVQTLALDLVLSAEYLGETFAVPSSFSLDSYLGQAWTLSPEGSISSVRLRFSPRVSDRVEDITWHKTQRTQRLADGSLVFEVNVDGLTEISHWILSFGEDVVVEKPAELQARIRQMAQSILKQYAE